MSVVEEAGGGEFSAFLFSVFIDHADVSQVVPYQKVVPFQVVFQSKELSLSMQFEALFVGGEVVTDDGSLRIEHSDDVVVVEFPLERGYRMFGLRSLNHVLQRGLLNIDYSEVAIDQAQRNELALIVNSHVHDFALHFQLETLAQVEERVVLHGAVVGYDDVVINVFLNGVGLAVVGLHDDVRVKHSDRLN